MRLLGHKTESNGVLVLCGDQIRYPETLRTLLYGLVNASERNLSTKSFEKLHRLHGDTQMLRNITMVRQTSLVQLEIDVIPNLLDQISL